MTSSLDAPFLPDWIFSFSSKVAYLWVVHPGVFHSKLFVEEPNTVLQLCIPGGTLQLSVSLLSKCQCGLTRTSWVGGCLEETGLGGCQAGPLQAADVLISASHHRKEALQPTLSLVVSRGEVAPPHPWASTCTLQTLTWSYISNKSIYGITLYRITEYEKQLV